MNHKSFSHKHIDMLPAIHDQLLCDLIYSKEQLAVLVSAKEDLYELLPDVAQEIIIRYVEKVLMR